MIVGLGKGGGVFSVGVKVDDKGIRVVSRMRVVVVGFYFF